VTDAPENKRGGWPLLAGFWALVLLVLLGGSGILAILGPPLPPSVEAEATQVEPQPVEPQPVVAAAVAAPPPAAVELPPRRAFARAFAPGLDMPRAAIVVGGMAMNTELTTRAIEALPLAVGLAFNPYAPQPDALLRQARARGFETLLALPTEPTGFPLHDPGPRALLTGLARGENAQRLAWLLARHDGHVGAVGALGPLRGERFAALTEPFEAMQRELEAAGWLYIDARPGEPPPRRVWGRAVDVVLDAPPTRAEIELRLTQLERLARERGTAMGYLGEASPVAVERIALWAAGLASRGVVLAPPSSMILPPSENAP